MPCVNTQNGQPVPGQMGSCPMGSTWAEPQAQQFTTLTEADKDIMQNAEKGTGIFGQDVYGAGGVDIGPSTLKTLGTTAIGAAAASPFIRGGINMLKDNKSAIGNKMKDLFGKLIMKQSKEYPKQAEKSYAWYMGLKGVDKVKALSLAGTGMGIQQLMSTMGDASAIKTAADTSNKAIKDAKDAADAKIAKANQATAKAEADRVAGLNPLERMMENMKKKGFWTDPINEKGSRTDTKLNRLGILMDYYGKDPKQRAASTSPSKQFAQSDKEYADTQAAYASAQATLAGKSDYSKPTVKNLASSLKNKVKERFGDTIFSFGAKDDELDSIAETVALRIIDINKIAPPGTDPRDIENLAMDQIEEEGWK